VIQQENTPKPASAESPVSQEQKVSTEENKETTPAPETKSMEDNKDKEQDQTNAELLKVMRDVLKTLQGPLIFTDGKHNFS
jgi:arsenate reductase-like glutaredoxin family protein